MSVPSENWVSPVPLADVLTARPVLVLVGGDVQLVSQKPTSLHAGQSRRHRVTPLGDKHDEGQRLRGAVQQVLTETQWKVSSGTLQPAHLKLLTSKCETMAAISSSQNGGLAWKEPLTGLKDRKGLDTQGYCRLQVSTTMSVSAALTPPTTCRRR